MQFWKKGYQQPTKMAVMWSHDVLSAPGTPPTRGFGGRIYFYNDRSQTIPVDGELIVHGFDDSQKREAGADKNVPDKRFRFTAEQFTKHYSESDIGASYSVWIPWDAVDGAQKEITLVPTFKGSKGEMVQGAPAKAMLPGRTAPGSQPVQTVSYERSSEPLSTEPLPQLGPPTAKRAESMRTTTIKLPAPLDRRPTTITTDLSGATNAVPSSNNSALATNAGLSASANAALEQARAQIIADAFRNAPAPAQSTSTPFNAQQSPNNLSPNNMPGARAVGRLSPIHTPPNTPPKNFASATKPSASPFMNSSSASNSPAVSSQTAVPQGSLNPVQQMQRALADENFGLPPGVQLTPRSP